MYDLLCRGCGELALARGDAAAADGFADQSLEIAVPTRF